MNIFLSSSQNDGASVKLADLRREMRNYTNSENNLELYIPFRDTRLCIWESGRDGFVDFQSQFRPTAEDWVY